MFRERRDLCSTCKHVRTCSGRSTPDNPIFSCEAYEVYVPGSVENGSETASQGGDAPRKLNGLCSNCEERETCLFPKSEGGVWHCDEYR